MKVVTWNILADQYIDFENLQVDYPTISAKSLSLDVRLPKILRWIRKSKGDIILLQEVTPPVRKALIEAFDERYWVGPLATHRGHEPNGTSSGTLSLVSRQIFPEEPKYETKFFAGSQSATGITYLPNLVLINVHFDWLVAERRKREARGVLRFVRTVHGPIIIGGDFNTGDDSLHRKFHAFVSGVRKHGSTFLCENPMIDYIYVRDAKVTSQGSIRNDPVKNRSKCFQNTLDKYGSDHYIVSTDISWP